MDFLKRLKVIYMVALAVVASCMLGSSWLVQRAIGGNSDEARVINLSGRQRMLPQRLTKAVLALSFEPHEAARALRLQEIRDSFQSWVKAHRGLQYGDPELGLQSHRLSPEILRIFEEIQPHHTAMADAVSHLLAHPATGGPSGEALRGAIATLLAHEPHFLSGMDAITFQFDREAREKLAYLQQLEYASLFLGLGILLLEFVFVFRPSLARIQTLLGELGQSQREQALINKTLEDTLDEATELARRANAAAEAKTAFLATMSHELRTPLNGIMGMTELLLMSGLSEEQQEFAATVKVCSQDLLGQIDKVLNYSRMGGDRADVVCSDFALRTTIRRQIDHFVALAEAKGVRLIMLVEPNVPDILRGDAGKLGQIVAHLLDNAVKYTDEGQIVLGVAVGSDGKDQVVLRFAVTDTGVGIARKNLPALFDPFTQGESYLTRRRGGSGLGLSICKRLIELMGGRLWVDSTEGQGSTFWFELVFLLPEH